MRKICGHKNPLKYIKNKSIKKINKKKYKKMSLFLFLTINKEKQHK